MQEKKINLFLLERNNFKNYTLFFHELEKKAKAIIKIKYKVRNQNNKLGVVWFGLNKISTLNQQ